MRCIDKECNHRQNNSGNDVEDYYYCKYVGITVETGEDECFIDKWEQEEESI